MITLKRLFYPESIAVIGASNKEGKLGYNVLRNLITHHYKGELYPINPNYDYIQGIKSYHDITEVKSDIDVAIVIVTARETPTIVHKCCDKGIKFIVNEAAGFSETGSTGKAIEAEFKCILRNSGSRMVGPNCSGIINTHHNMVQAIGLVGPLKRGGIGIIAQAGVYASGMLWGLRKIMDFGIIATTGNKLDINETDFLEFMGSDPHVSVICMYLEDIKAGRRFIDVAKNITRTKPIIVLKGSRTEQGAVVAKSHTASIAGNIAIYNAVFTQSRIIKASDNEEMLNLVKTFSKQPLPKGPGIMIISYAGSMGVTGVDTCYENGLRIAKISQSSIEKLRSIIPSYVAVQNPVDLTFDQNANQVADIINVCNDEEDVAAFIVNIQAEFSRTYFEPLKKLEACGKPILVSIPGKNFVMDMVIKLERIGLPVFETPEIAVRMLAKMYHFYTHSKSTHT